MHEDHFAIGHLFPFGSYTDIVSSPPPPPLSQAGADALVPSGGFTSRNGFWMLRGDVPHLSMVRSMPGWLKSTATLLFGRFFVPTVHYEPAYFRAGARRVLSRIRELELDCKVGLVGGVTSLSVAGECVSG